MISSLQLTLFSLILTSSPILYAGSISNNHWQASNCGEKPATPLLENKLDFDAYNKAVENVNEWQKKANVYFECLVKEANSDTAIIVESAKHDQTVFRDDVDKIFETLETAKKKLQ